jgi:hypothetical protein
MSTEERPLENGWLPDTPIEDSVLRRFVMNQAELNEIVAEACGGRVVRTDDVSCADARSPVPFLNQAVLLRPLSSADDPVLGHIERSFSAEAILLSVWPTPSLHSRGWHLMGHPMFVVRAPGPVPAHERPGVRVRDVHALDDIGVFERVLVEGYPLPEGAGEPPGSFFPPAVLERGVRLRLGVLDGEAVGTGAVLAAYGVVNLVAAATLPVARRRGVWQALVWSRVAEAPGLPAVAFTSDFSRPGFERMGFLPIIRLTLWYRGGTP